MSLKRYGPQKAASGSSLAFMSPVNRLKYPTRRPHRLSKELYVQDMHRIIPCRAYSGSDEEDEEEELMEQAMADFDYDEEEVWNDDGSLRLYLDCADVKVWEKWAETGLFYGFTTNPTILKRDNVPCTMPSMRQLSRHAFTDLGAQELQLQAWGTVEAELYSCALDLYELDERVVVKIPATLEGLKATRRLVDDDVPVTLTGIHSTHQVLTSLAAGALYAAVYLGRMNDAGKNAYEEIAQMQSIIDMCTNVEGEMRLLVASIRSVDDITKLAAEGCNTFTIGPSVAEHLVIDPLTEKAAAQFQKDAIEMGAGKKT